jgi:ABC-type sulfate transport system substrate-binding protein
VLHTRFYILFILHQVKRPVDRTFCPPCPNGRNHWAHNGIYCHKEEVADLIAILLLVIGCYALAAASVHVAYRLRRGKTRESKHYVLVAHDQHMKMEMFIRQFSAYSRRMGTDVHLTVVDGHSADQTAQIIERLREGNRNITVYADEGLNDRKRSQSENPSADLMWTLRSEGIVSRPDQAILVDLQNPSDLSKMPF